MAQLRLSIIHVLFVSAFFVCLESKPNRRDTGCEEIKRRTMCSDMGYDHTMFPNAIGHETAEEALTSLEITLTGLASVIGTGDQCYNLIRTFMCHWHVPMCVVQSSTALPPCRETCELLFSNCGNIMQTIPQISNIDCEMAPYSSGNLSMPNCAPVSPFAEANICCPRPFKNIGGACVKILKKARPYKSSTKSCESEQASLAKFAPPGDLFPFLQSELFDSAENMWLGIAVEDGPRLVWTFDGTDLAPEYLMSERLASLAEGGLADTRRICFSLGNDGQIRDEDCRNTNAPSLCQRSNDCPYGISSTPRAVVEAPSGEDQTENEGGDGAGEGNEDVDKPLVPIPESGECETQTMVLCRDVGYTETRFPNALGIPNQGDAFTELKKWAPLIAINCSPHMKELLCSLYAPPCISTSLPAQLPCREVCEAAKDGCLPQMQRFGHDWPKVINCTKFPSHDGSDECYMGSVTPPVTSEDGSCEVIEDPLCSGTGYLETIMPNAFGQTTQMEASVGINEFQSLLLLECSPALKPFLCGMFFPVCGEGTRMLPCRSVCEAARSGCELFIKAVGMDWPQELDCANLPSLMGDEPCFIPDGIEMPVTPEQDPISESCEEIRSSMCVNLEYSSTSLPNSLGHETQEEVNAVMLQMYPLVKLGCSPHLEELLCVLHFPPCGTSPPSVPCRELCEAAREGCGSVMEEFGFESISCEGLPSMEDNMCYSGSLDDSVVPPSSSGCENITVPLCMEGMYSSTSMPNAFDHMSQDEAGLEVHQFYPLVKVECSPHLREFLCLVYVPPCGFISRKPCRELCEAARDGCELLMLKFGFRWPERLECTEFPSIRDDSSCNMGSVQLASQSCRELTAPSCSHMPYTETASTNSTEQIEAQMAEYVPLIQFGCSSALTTFFCSINAPPCDDRGHPLPPCRELCEEAISGCPILEQVSPDLSSQCLLLPERSSQSCFYAVMDTVTNTESTQSCQSPTPPSCSHMPYNMTASTNSTEEIEAQMAVYMPLIQTGCSSSLISFFCSIHAPPCDDMGRQLIPCREMCEEAIGGCPILEQVSPGISSQCLLYPARSSGNCFYFVGEAETAPDMCEPLEISACQGLGYTHTSFPNYFSHQTQAEAESFSTIFASIKEVGTCGNVALEYICQLLAPRCLGDPLRRVPPCRRQCELTSMECSDIFKAMDVESVFGCELLDVYGSYCEDTVDEAGTEVNFTNVATLPPSACVPTQISMCAELGFLLTLPPEALSTEGNGDMSDIIPLVETMCSPLLLPLTCSIYTPKCDPGTGGVMPPCREICRDVLKDCKKTLKGMGIDAPSILSCKRYPSEEDGSCHMNVAPPLRPTIVSYTRTDSSLTITVAQPEGSHDTPGRGFSGYTIIHDMGFELHFSDGTETSVTLSISPEQSQHHIVITVVPFNEFGVGPAADILTKSDTSTPRPANLQLSPRPEEDGTIIVDEPLLQIACSNAADDVMAYPEWSRNEELIEVEGYEANHYQTKRYGERSTVLVLTKADAATYTCSLEGESETRELRLKMPCVDLQQSFCGYESVQLPNYYGHTSESQASAGAMAFLPLIQAQCSERLFEFVCSTFIPKCNTPLPPPCREFCEMAMDECSAAMLFSGVVWPEASSCENFPPMAEGNCYSGIDGAVELTPEPESEPEPEMTPEPEPETGPRPEPDVTPEPEPEMTHEPGHDMSNVTDVDSSNAAQPPTTLKKRRYDIVNQGVAGKFQGWADVQGQGAANDYCRVLKFKKKRFYLACALAGADDEEGYTSPDIKSGDFDEGERDTWYMKDEDGDGRDDFCRCVSHEDTPYVSCMRAGDSGFEGHYDFKPTMSNIPEDCTRVKVNPFLGHPPL